MWKRSGGEVIPIMLEDTYNNAFKHRNLSNYIKELEEISNRKIIFKEEEAERIDVDVIVAAPFSRKSYCKTKHIYIWYYYSAWN